MNEPLAVAVQRRAAREIEAVDEWWRANRTASPDLFVSELDTMLFAVALMPALGAPAKAERASGVRRVLSAERGTTSTIAFAAKRSKCSPSGMLREAWGSRMNRSTRSTARRSAGQGSSSFAIRIDDGEEVRGVVLDGDVAQAAVFSASA